MKCPACVNAKLIRCSLEPTLQSLACRQCGGNWVEAQQYFRWLELSGEAGAGGDSCESPTPESEPTEFAPADSAPLAPATPAASADDDAKARLCPECGRLLARLKVGHGVPFRIDHCGTCGGTWLDAGEWEALRDHGLHRTLHRVFSPTWQAELTRLERRAEHEELLRRMLGPDELAQVRRFADWIKCRPKRSELLAVLLAEVKDG
jgi:Zn-finger nucleic acid-binding protein